MPTPALATTRTEPTALLDPAGGLPQPAWRVDNDFSPLFPGELLLAVETLNIDAASFRQMEEAARPPTAARRDEAGATGRAQ